MENKNMPTSRELADLIARKNREVLEAMTIAEKAKAETARLEAVKRQKELEAEQSLEIFKEYVASQVAMNLQLGKVTPAQIQTHLSHLEKDQVVPTWTGYAYDLLMSPIMGLRRTPEGHFSFDGKTYKDLSELAGYIPDRFLGPCPFKGVDWFKMLVHHVLKTDLVTDSGTPLTPAMRKTVTIAKVIETSAKDSGSLPEGLNMEDRQRLVSLFNLDATQNILGM